MFTPTKLSSIQYSPAATDDGSLRLSFFKEARPRNNDDDDDSVAPDDMISCAPVGACTGQKGPGLITLKGLAHPAASLPTPLPSPNRFCASSPRPGHGTRSYSVSVANEKRRASNSCGAGRTSGLGNVSTCSDEQLVEWLSGNNNKILLVDVRPTAQYVKRHIRNAVSMCFPTTLLKRPAFTISQLLKSVGQREQCILGEWKSYDTIVIYDADSTDFSCQSSLVAVLTCSKFYADKSCGWNGSVYCLKGGLKTMAQGHPKLMYEQNPSSSSSEKVHISPPNIGNLKPQKSFFDNVRQNMDLIDGVGAPIPVNLERISRDVDYDISLAIKSLPSWMQKVLGPSGPQYIANKFLLIEQEEQLRVESAIACLSSIPVSAPSSISITNTLLGQFTVGESIHHCTKNRYKNVYPYDKTRVHLKKLTGLDQEDDYINASYVSCFNSRRKHIATQAPLPTTFIDFWHMVWQENTRVIVILTALQENGTVRCHDYWSGIEYGPFCVECLGIEQQQDDLCQVRTLKVKCKLDCCESRIVKIVHYTSWPDFGCAPSSLDVGRLCHVVDELRAQSEKEILSQKKGNLNPPVIVHCSAGCGRSGSFCTIDIVLDILKRQTKGGKKAEGLPSPDEDLVTLVVQQLRMQRLSMVQSLRQFVHCYESVIGQALYERLFEAKTSTH